MAEVEQVEKTASLSERFRHDPDPEVRIFHPIREHLGIDPSAPVAQQILNTKFLSSTPCMIDINELYMRAKRNGGSLEMNVINKDGGKLDLLEALWSE